MMLMYELKVPKPLGHLIATGQVVAIPMRDRPDVLKPVDTAIRVAAHAELAHSTLEVLETAGADLGPSKNYWFNEAGAYVALATVQWMPFPKTAANVLRASSLNISGTEDWILGTLGQDWPEFALWLTDIRPLSVTVLTAKGLDDDCTLRRLCDAGIQMEILSVVGVALVIPEPQVS